MLRTHLMSQATADIAVGFQHKHEGVVSAFLKIYRAHGIVGLYRGVSVTLPRGMIGSGSQIAAFGWTKDTLQRKTELDATYVSLISGFVAGTFMAVAMNPADVVAVRLYNQGTTAAGKGLLYSGVTDCLVKIFKTEGVAGFYKGFFPHYLRIGPHSTLVLMFFDELKSLKAKLNSW